MGQLQQQQSSCATQSLRRTELTLWIEKVRCGAAFWKLVASKGDAQRRTWPLFPGCSEKIWAADRPAGGVSESYYRNLPREEAANMLAEGKLREADGWESQPALDHNTGCRDVQLWQLIIMVDSLCYCLQMPLAQCPWSQ